MVKDYLDMRISTMREQKMLAISIISCLLIVTLGGFFYFNASKSTAYGSAFLKTPKLRPTGPRSRCLTFWYRLSGTTITHFSVHLLEETKNNVNIWETTEKFGSQWQFGRVPVVTKKDFTLHFEVVQKNASETNAYVHIDDVVITEGPCSVLPPRAELPTTPKVQPLVETLPPVTNSSSRFNCTFEDFNSCSWTTRKDKKGLAFSVISGANPNYQYSGPSFDHTKGKGKDGSYAYLYATRDQLNGSAILESYTAERTDGRCLVFWYHMWGSVNTLNVYIKRDGFGSHSLGDLIWQRKGSQGNVWKRATINFKEMKPFKFIIEAVASERNLMCNIAIDDIMLSSDSCIGDESFCDFEDEDKCQFSEFPSNSWERSNPLEFPNITFDHSAMTKFGHFALLSGIVWESTFSTKEIPDLENNYKCLRFWYKISSKVNSSYLTVTTSVNPDMEYFHSYNDLNWNHGWSVGEATIEPTNRKDTQIVFNGKLADLEKDYIALDDVRIRDGFCGYEGDCNFEDNDLCTWSNDEDGDFNWAFQRGQTETVHTEGPDYDHSFESPEGTYLYIESSSPNKVGDKARIFSQTFPKLTNSSDMWRCLHFWYHMMGKTVGSLTVYQKFAAYPQEGLWQLRGTQIGDWQYAKVPFVGKAAYKMVIEATVGSDSADIAIDDLVVSDGLCSLEPQKARYVPPKVTTASTVTPTEGKALGTKTSLTEQRTTSLPTSKSTSAIQMTTRMTTKFTTRISDVETPKPTMTSSTKITTIKRAETTAFGEYGGSGCDLEESFMNTPWSDSIRDIFQNPVIVEEMIIGRKEIVDQFFEGYIMENNLEAKEVACLSRVKRSFENVFQLIRGIPRKELKALVYMVNEKVNATD